MGYQSLTIENFRGISKLEISDLKRVNLLVGRNNCGKTTVLEACFILAGIMNPQLSVYIHNLRDLIINSDEDFSFMFYQMDIKVPIVLNGQINNKKRELRITPLFSEYTPENRIIENGINGSQEHYIVSSNPLRLIEGIKLEGRDHQNKLSKGEYSQKKKNVIIPENYREDFDCIYLNPKIMTSQMDKRMESLIVEKKLDPIIAVLKEIELRITDIRIAGGDRIYIDVGADKLLPINIMGDGVRRILAFLATIAILKNGILLIDEIENGLHYSALKIVWKAILAACKEYNVQLIATTHSYECIEALTHVYSEIEPEGDDIRLFRLERNGEDHKAFSASAQALKAGIAKEFEIR